MIQHFLLVTVLCTVQTRDGFCQDANAGIHGSPLHGGLLVLISLICDSMRAVIKVKSLKKMFNIEFYEKANANPNCGIFLRNYAKSPYIQKFSYSVRADIPAHPASAGQRHTPAQGYHQTFGG